MTLTFILITFLIMYLSFKKKTYYYKHFITIVQLCTNILQH